MNLLTQSIEQKIRRQIFTPLIDSGFSLAERGIISILETLYDDIPAQAQTGRLLVCVQVLHEPLPRLPA